VRLKKGKLFRFSSVNALTDGAVRALTVEREFVSPVFWQAFFACISESPELA
jgi:hypothetical protein